MQFNVDGGPDLIVRNGTYLRVDTAPGDHVLDHKYEFFFGSDPQMVHLKQGETVYFQYVGVASLVFEVDDDQAQAARTVSKMRSKFNKPNRGLTSAQSLFIDNGVRGLRHVLTGNSMWTTALT
jgi:hypothetical protein